MAKKITSFVFCSGIAILVVVSAFAQDTRVTSAAGDKYLISARAGGVNFTDGAVGVVRKNGRAGQLLKGDELDIGDRVSTGADGKAEILLNPGSFMRLGGVSAFELKTTSLDDLEIRLDSGTAMFEVFATNDFTISIATPKARLTLIESGIYRVEVGSDGGAKILVWGGRAMLGDTAKTLVKKGRAATLLGGKSTVAKFDRDVKDAFVSWSKVRGKDLAKASASLKNKAMRGLLINSFNSGRWGLYNSFGLWVHDASLGRSCFLPFGSGWYSPYGYGYGNSIWWYNLPQVIYQQPVPDRYGIKTRARGDAAVADHDERPPFMKVENPEGARNNSPVRQAPDLMTDRPTYVPAYTPPVIFNAPANTGAKTRP